VVDACQGLAAIGPATGVPTIFGVITGRHGSRRLTARPQAWQYRVNAAMAGDFDGELDGPESKNRCMQDSGVELLPAFRKNRVG